ncbi:hypothetical protein SERLADRAFT_414163 [Serpula lacrymans var. lacrymans S7.9]|uniref:Aminoglycoside phosphotransferase domain-containing protein n=1 Tax=Serpula lacrymans var. lacrymans (strain S7.9) TaxID=578457 RepID=F8NN37_SERL9|nr:uncharacterized protein SERLADRAFT_414163 [Serpula lacrymans var. lacrymans S7.9]EGO27958.1 hypothetical protein SERLADRAFT_414163 [Serpula lacrymans var. lacrymans S7.9]
MNKTLTGKSPSANTKSANYHAHQEQETPFLDGRYAKRSTSTLAPPIELFHHVFAEFKANACNASLHPPSDIIGHTVKLMEVASQISTTEICREKLTQRYLTDILCRGFGQGVNFNRTSSDHLVVATRSVNPAEIAAVALVEEEKAELGWGGDPSIQGSFSYLQFWAGADHEHIRNATCCPSFIIGIGGPWVVILGAVITSSPIIQRLTDYLWLGHSRVIDDSYALRLAHILYSLQLAMCTLNEYYMNFTPPSPAERKYRFFPSITSYRFGAEQVVNFKYQQPLESDATLLASKGMAPQLWHCGPIWHGSERSYGELQTVVTEYVEGQTAASKYSGRSIPETVREFVRRAATCLADNLMVHGDLRRPNIFVVKNEEEKVMIIDFDWAGKDGVVRYPLHLSRGVQWAEGVEDYGLIKIEHDAAMVNRL